MSRGDVTSELGVALIMPYERLGFTRRVSVGLIWHEFEAFATRAGRNALLVRFERSSLCHYL